MSNIQPRLPYNYARILTDSGLCVGCATYSYEINHVAYIPVPHASDNYMGKYYNRDLDLWFEDELFTIEATEINAMYHGN